MQPQKQGIEEVSPVLFCRRLQLKIGAKGQERGNATRLLIDDMPAKVARQIIQQKLSGPELGLGSPCSL